MKTKQLNVRLPASLVDGLKAEAASSGMTLNALVERRLSGDLATAKPVEPDLAADLATRLAAVEKRLATLEAAGAAAPKPSPRPTAVAAAQGPGALVPLSPTVVASKATPPPKLTAHPDAITGPELAEKYGVKRTSFNEKVRRLGGGRVGLVVELNGDRWRCVGQVSRATGGSPLWVWEAA